MKMATRLPAFSKLGFGTYRTGLEVPAHAVALRECLRGGVNVIDTSTNFLDGEAERLIAVVMHTMAEENDARPLRRQDVIIISKAGYIQGKTLERFRAGEISIPETDVVTYSSDCLHSIHADFIRDQITQSLERLGTDYIDIYLLHNPEYYLLKNVTPEMSQDEVLVHRRRNLEKIRDAFVELEREVQRGRIRGYGISSNSFSLKESDVFFLPYEGLIDHAIWAAEAAGNVTHSFIAVEFPANILEIEGLKGCGQWAHDHGLRVLVNRPLNAFTPRGSFRLASYPEPARYEQVRDEVIAHFSRRGDTWSVVNLLRELDPMKTEFGSTFHFEYALDTDTLLLQQFLDTYKEAVRYHCSLRTERMVEELGIGYSKKPIADNGIDRASLPSPAIGTGVGATQEPTNRGREPEMLSGECPLEEFCLTWLMKQPQVDCVLNGITKESYARTALKLLHREEA